MIEFIASRKKITSGAVLSPSTLCSYILGIKLEFRNAGGYDVDLFTSPVFGDKQNGVEEDLDNKIRELRGQGAARKIQNTLTEDDVQKLYKCAI